MRLVLPVHSFFRDCLPTSSCSCATPAVDIIGPFQIPPEVGSQSFLAHFRGIALSSFRAEGAGATVALAALSACLCTLPACPSCCCMIAGSAGGTGAGYRLALLPAGFAWRRAERSAGAARLRARLIFAAAMRFDLSDRLRTTRRSDCAFWLHLLAAPLIVHSLVMIAAWWLMPFVKTYGIERMTANLVGAIAAIIVVLALVAIVIDRRALLVSALTYLGAVVGLRHHPGDGQGHQLVFYATLLVLRHPHSDASASAGASCAAICHAPVAPRGRATAAADRSPSGRDRRCRARSASCRCSRSIIPCCATWLAEPHMQEWWGDPDEELGYIRDMVEGRDTTRPFLIALDGGPVGYIQYWFIGHHQNEQWITDHPWLDGIAGRDDRRRSVARRPRTTCRKASVRRRLRLSFACCASRDTTPS